MVKDQFKDLISEISESYEDISSSFGSHSFNSTGLYGAGVSAVFTLTTGASK